MASGVYNRCKKNLMTSMDLENDTIKVMLLDSNHSFNVDHNTKADIVANEVSGSGYSAGGQALTNKSLTQDDDNDKAYFDADNPKWQDSSITASHAIFYDDDLDDDDLLLSVEFDQSYTSTNGDFELVLDSDGILEVS